MKNKIIPNPYIAKNNEQTKLEQFDAYKKIRKIWKIDPTTKVKVSKKLYDRKKMKREIKKLLKEEDF